jgi:hypothetical protein
MGISVDGDNKLIILDTLTSFTAQAIYNACVSWAALSGNMKYLLPMSSVGKAAIGGGIYTDLIFIQQNGYKIKPSGYAANTQIVLVGTLVTSDSSLPTLPPTIGSPVQWLIQATTAATIVVSGGGGGLTQQQVADAVWTRAIEAGFTAEQILRILAAEAAGTATGLEGANPVFKGLDGTTTRIDGGYNAGVRTINSRNGV